MTKVGYKREMEVGFREELKRENMPTTILLSMRNSSAVTIKSKL